MRFKFGLLGWWGNDFAHMAVLDGITKYYFGDEMEQEKNEWSKNWVD